MEREYVWWQCLEFDAQLGGRMFSILENVAFDTGYAGSNGLEPQSWVNGNGTLYIHFGLGEFDGQGSDHDYLGTVSLVLMFCEQI